jgi:hypothetical protein
VAARATFGDFAGGAGQNLNALDPGQGPARHGDVQEITGAVLGAVSVLRRYVSDVGMGFADATVWEKRALGPWARASIDAHKALGCASGLLRIHYARTVQPGPENDRGMQAQQLAGVSALLTAGRDLLHTHFAPGGDGVRRDHSYWAPVITSVPVGRALLGEVASWARQIAAWGTKLPLRPDDDLQTGWRLQVACRWLWTADSVVQLAQHADPVSAAERELLYAIPANVPPVRRQPDPAMPISGLCEGTAESAERVRYAAWARRSQTSRLPEPAMASLRRTAETCTVTSHHCAVLMRSLADLPTVPGGLAARLGDCADAAERARGGWLSVASALQRLGFTTLNPGSLAREARASGDLALWTGRLAYDDPAWSLARGPSHTPRPRASLAPTEWDMVAVMSAVHHATDALNWLARSEHHQIKTRAAWLMVPTRSLPEKMNIPRPYASAPPDYIAALLSAYREAGRASAEACGAVADVAAERSEKEHLVAGMLRMGSLGIGAACLMMTGCSAQVPPAAVHSPGGGEVAPSQKSTAACFLLSATQMQAAMRMAVGPGKPLLSGVCVHPLPHGIGTLDYDVTTFSSAAQARSALRSEERSDVGVSGLKIVSVPRLGQAAVAVTGQQGALALVVTGRRELEVSISWPETTYQMVVTLAREAFRRL